MHPLEAYRTRKGLTLSRLATELGVRHPHLSRIVRGTGQPSTALIRRIVEVTRGEVTAEDMLGKSLYLTGTDVNNDSGSEAA